MVFDKYFIKQHDATDCGAACLLSIIRYYGGNSSIKQLREISGTSIQGTTLLGLYQAAQKVGFDAQGCEADIKSLIEHGKPVILHTLIDGKFEHYIVCFEYNNGKFTISNPAVGIEYYTPEELDKIWVSKNCLTLEPNENFVSQSEIKAKKHRWIIDLIREDATLLSISIIIGVILAAMSMVMAVFSQQLVDNILPNKDIQKLLWGLGLVFILMICQAFITALRQQILITQAKGFNNRIIDFFYTALLNLPKSFFDTRKTGDIVARLNDTRRIQTVISTLFNTTVIEVLMALVSIVFLSIYSWQIAIVTMLCMPVFFWIVYRHNSRITAKQRDVMISYSLTESNFISTIKGISTIKSFNRQSIFKQLNKSLYELFQTQVFNLGRIQIRLGVLSGIAGTVIILGLITYSSLQVIDNTITLGDMMAIIGVIGTLLPAIANLALVAIPINEAKVAFERMFEVIGEADEPNSEDKKEISLTTPVQINVSNLDFRFVGRRKILTNININFEPNSVTCIVGESGCGKSTLCQILERFYIPEHGNICINGENIYNFSDISWQSIVSVVPQDIFIVDGTIVDNICFGQPVNDPNVVVEFCKKYGFDKYINALPQGYATIVGEEGINLSGGQRQLIAFARALFKPFEVLILDELTSALDRNTENHILELLWELKKSKTIIMTSHRLDTVRRISDQIVILENGCVTAAGTHEHLMETSNFYSDYWKIVLSA